MVVALTCSSFRYCVCQVLSMQKSIRQSFQYSHNLVESEDKKINDQNSE